ncbi:bifunctional phosphopantothenoylcysteine decarboxylase/phosphopantothenate--cysteine ligase CoaBC [Desulfosoma sp.]|uniref:bifunctional phosphopantothenoylcysteine decarboxylase/phosphopantothenate--cysteine ligase CoaBC n=1 Tax=Desulfosoma sp. TaxID=2603217 RepID=UPI00404A44D6
MERLRGKTVLVGVTGSIAAYKAAELVRWLVKCGAGVQVIMTRAAQQFLTPLTLQALSGRPVLTDLFDLGLESEIGHIHAARSVDLVLVAPATANTLAKMACGIADNYLTTVLLAVEAPVVVCPAMNHKMYTHPATQDNLAALRRRGVWIVEPASGPLACGEEGHGRLADLSLILETVCRALTPQTLRGKRVLVSAGPTWEPFDPVRFITNPSSGKMGFALAVEAARRGAHVDLVSGPTALPDPPGLITHHVTTARDMEHVVRMLAHEAHLVIMAAAVSDYRPEEAAPHKFKKDDADLEIRLVRNPDILAGLGKDKKPGQILVGFAAETQDLVRNATEKLHRKNLDLIVANDLTQPGAGFRTDTNVVKVLDRGGGVEEWPCLSKEAIARRLLDRIEALGTT